MKLLVTGAAGMLGRAVMAAGAGRHAMTGVDLSDGDLREAGVAGRFLELHEPDRIIHCAAFTDVDGAESRREAAMAVNGDATALLAEACSDRGCALTCLSTDYVFAGDGQGYDEDAVRDPVNWYGRTKAAAEEAVAILSTPWQIVRTSWLFGAGERNFVLSIRRLLQKHDTLRVVDDQFGCPTYSADLAVALLWLADSASVGYFHVTNSGSCSWFDFAREIARLGGDDPRRISPCPSSDYPTPARRPACSVLHSRRYEATGASSLPTWQDALARYLDELKQSNN